MKHNVLSSIFLMLVIGLMGSVHQTTAQDAPSRIHDCFSGTGVDVEGVSYVEFTKAFVKGTQLNFATYTKESTYYPYTVTLSSDNPAFYYTTTTDREFSILLDHTFPALHVHLQTIDNAKTDFHSGCIYSWAYMSQKSHEVFAINTNAYFWVYVRDGKGRPLANTELNIQPIPGENTPRLARRAITDATGLAWLIFEPNPVPARYGFAVYHGHLPVDYAGVKTFDYVEPWWVDVLVHNLPPVMDEGMTVSINFGLSKLPNPDGGNINLIWVQGDCTSNQTLIPYTPTTFTNLELQITATNNDIIGDNLPCQFELVLEAPTRDGLSDILKKRITIPIFDNEQGDIFEVYTDLVYVLPRPQDNPMALPCDETTSDTLLQAGSGLYCNPLSDTPVGVPDNILALGIIRLHDLAYYENGQSFAYFPDGQYRLACLSGQGRLFLGEASSSPRRWSWLENAYEVIENEVIYTCAYLPSPGTLVLVNP